MYSFRLVYAGWNGRRLCPVTEKENNSFQGTLSYLNDNLRSYRYHTRTKSLRGRLVPFHTQDRFSAGNIVLDTEPLGESVKNFKLLSHVCVASLTQDLYWVSGALGIESRHTLLHSLLTVLQVKMASMALFFLMLCIPTLASASYNDGGPPPHPFWRRSNVPPQGYFDPKDNGGSLLTVCHSTSSLGCSYRLFPTLSKCLERFQLDSGNR